MADQTVRVAVDALADRPERTFSYRWTDGLGAAEPGSLVLVPYGRRLALGYLLAGEPDAGVGELKDVEAVVSAPMLTGDLLDLAGDVASYYRAPIGTTLASMLPPGLESRLARRWVVVDAASLAPEIAALAREGVIEDAPLLRHAPRRGRDAWLERLRRGGALRAEWSLRPPEVAERRVRVLRRVGDGVPARRAPLQVALLEAVADGEATFPDLADRLGVDAGRLLSPARRLADQGLAELDWRTEIRDPLAHRRARPDPMHDLAAEQVAAVAAINRLAPGGELLLEGVAAAGKTEVYLAALAETLAGGRGAILLVPELSGVAQLVDRVTAAVGEPVVALHSGLSGGERHDAWWRILRREARVVVGTRSAIMAPVQPLGLVIVDEAHDGAYKSDRTPRLDARWVARRRAQLTGARVVLGTATPDVVTVSRTRGGLVERARLRERRVGSAPAVEVVDLREELAAGNRSIFSRPLVEALGALRPGTEQAIMLINRRGAATFVLCRDCGESVRCPDCDLPYVFHLSGGRLRCHHCGRTAEPPDACPRCGSRRIRYFGAGTQRVEAELRAGFPRLRVGRLDSDVLAAGRGYERIYDDFAAGAFDVLVGTQLAAKGLDLPSVTLSAVIAADVTLNLPDYLAPERTFQLLAQVAGRAGRGPMPGRVVIQTYAPTHYAVRAAAAGDVDGFADEELPRRRLLGYPPASVLARLLVADADRDRAEARGREAAEAVSVPGVEALGPLPAYVPRRAGRWRMQVVVRSESTAARAAALERVPPGVAIDVDPESLL